MPATAAGSKRGGCSLSTAALTEQNRLKRRGRPKMTYRASLAIDDNSRKIRILAIRQTSGCAQNRPDTLLHPVPASFGRSARSAVLRLASPASQPDTSAGPLKACSRRPWTASRPERPGSSCGLGRRSWTGHIASKRLPACTYLILLKFN